MNLIQRVEDSLNLAIQQIEGGGDVAKWWDWLVVQVSGKDIAVLGPRASGKTTLQNFLLYDRVPDGSPDGSYEQTVAPERTTWKRNKSLGLNISRGVDLPGGDAFYAAWRSQAKRADLIFYLFDSCKLRCDSKYAQRVAEDGRQLKSWDTNGARVMLVGTHADTDPSYVAMKEAAYSELILDHDVIAAFQTRASVKAAAIGDLRTAASVEKILKRVLHT